MENNQPVTPSTGLMPSPSQSSKRPLILILILIILAAAAIVVFYFINQITVPSAPVVTPPSPQPTTALSTAVPTAPAPIEDDLQSLDLSNDLESEFTDIDADLQQL